MRACLGFRQVCLLGKGIRERRRLRAVQEFAQAVDDKFVVGNMIEIGGNDSADDSSGTFDADGKASAAEGIVLFSESVCG